MLMMIGSLFVLFFSLYFAYIFLLSLDSSKDIILFRPIVQKRQKIE